MSYSEKVLDHFNNPRNTGSMDENDINVGTAKIGSPSCGDVIKLQIRVENNIIVDVKFKAFGCGSAIASSSLATEWMKNMTIDSALEYVSKEALANELSLPPVKIHCSILAREALEAAIRNYKEKNA